MAAGRSLGSTAACVIEGVLTMIAGYAVFAWEARHSDYVPYDGPDTIVGHILAGAESGSLTMHVFIAFHIAPPCYLLTFLVADAVKNGGHIYGTSFGSIRPNVDPDELQAMAVQMICPIMLSSIGLVNLFQLVLMSLFHMLPDAMSLFHMLPDVLHLVLRWGYLGLLFCVGTLAVHKFFPWMRSIRERARVFVAVFFITGHAFFLTACFVTRGVPWVVRCGLFGMRVLRLLKLLLQYAHGPSEGVGEWMVIALTDTIDVSGCRYRHQSQG